MRRNCNALRTSSLRLRWALLAASPIALAMMPTAHAQEQIHRFDIQQQPLSSALLVLGRQADLSVVAPTSLTMGKTGALVQGEMSVATALERLLADSGLTFVFVQSDAVKIVTRQEQAALDLGQGSASGSDRASLNARLDANDRVIVTGTNIRGTQPTSSAVDIYSREDIAKSGATTTEQFVGKLPQNVSTFSQYAPGANTAGSNTDAVNSVDLRGLGVGTTLTLVNGRRISLSNGGRSADVSLIPAAALERVEVLSDGASAIYGSDAIGGVINFILRDDFEGAETRLSYGGVTSGGLRQTDASQTVGTVWAGGNALAAYNFHAASALETSDRPYSAAAGPGYLTPVDTRHHLFLTGSQDLGDRLTLSADFGQSWRKVKNTYSNLSSPVIANRTFNRYVSQTDQIFGSLAAEYRLTDDLLAEISGAYSEIDIDGFSSLVRPNRVPPTTTVSNFGTRNSQFDVMGKLGGALWALPGGDVRFSVGAGVLEEEFKGRSPITNVQSAGSLGRKSTYAFAEIWAPLIGPAQDVPLMHTLAFSLAARYTDYEDTSEAGPKRDFGDSIDPKVGFAWEPFDTLRLRGTYGRSFRAPSLTQLDRTGGLHYLTNEIVGGQNSILLAVTGYGETDLAPETAKTYTFGFDYSPDWDDGLRVSATYYNIDYTNRIDIAPIGGLNPFTTPTLLPDLIYRPPSEAFIEDALRETRLLFNTTPVDITNPAAGAATLYARPDVWVYDTRFKNLALSQQEGIDLNVSQDLATSWGNLNLGANLTHILKYDKQGSGSSAVLPASDVPGGPANWRGRVNAGFSYGPTSATLGVNYVDAYANPSSAAGRQKIDSWTTVDLALAYDFDRADGFSALQGTRFSLSVQNLFDADPPLLASGVGSNIVLPVGFDPANANPLGTLIVLGISKTW